MKRRVTVPAALAVAMVALSCKQEPTCKRCYPETFYHDAAVSDADAGPPPECPTSCIDEAKACPAGCEEPPVA